MAIKNMGRWATRLVKAFIPLPAGATAVYTSSGLAYYRHSDWLGSSRLATTPSRAKYFDVAYAPFGENYADSGTTDYDFTGQNQDTVTRYYDFLFREYAQVQGRWISPDPAGRAAANPMSPQSWNRYAYVGNQPLNSVDRLGLVNSCIIDGQEVSDDMLCNWLGGGGDEPYYEMPLPVDRGDPGFLPGENSVNLPAPPLIPDNIMPILNFVLFGQPIDWNSVLWGANCMPICDATKAANNGTPTTPVIGPANGKSIPNVPPEWGFCSKYRDGSGGGSALYQICMNTPNSPWGNCVRGKLLNQYTPNPNPPELFVYLFVDHPIDFASCLGK